MSLFLLLNGELYWIKFKNQTLLDSMKNDNNKPTTSRKFIKQNKKSEQSNKGL